MAQEHTPRKITLFGGLRVEADGAPIHIPGNKTRWLLVYLALHADHAHSRGDLAARLDPAAGARKARRRLTDTLYQLRRALGVGWLAAEGDSLRLRRDANLWVDIWEFAVLQEAGDEASLEAAIALYGGDLAPEISTDWILPRRVYFREAYLDSLLHVGRRAEQTSRLEKALRSYRRLTAADPFREDGRRGVMRSLAALQRLPEALAGYERFRDRLAAELDAVPAPETRELARRLRREHEARQAPAPGGPTPFVGRSVERARLLDCLDRLDAGSGGIAVVLGEAGSGKTRLLQTIQESAVWRGCQVFYGSCEELALPAPYAPLPAVLAGALPPVRAQQLAQLLAPYSLALLARILPAFEERLERSDSLDPPGDDRQLAAAVGQLLTGLAEIAPHVLILDDVQWADVGLWPLLTRLQPLLDAVPLLIILAGRRTALQEQEQAFSAVRSWERGGAPIIALPPLELKDLRRLAVSVGGTEIDDEMLASLNAGSGGNPLLALALLTSDDQEGVATRPDLAGLIERRLARLSQPAHLALQAAAVLGFQFDYGVWAAIAPDMLRENMPLLAGELERRRMLALAGAAYRFEHDTLRAYVYETTPAARRRQLHQRALTALRRDKRTAALALLRHAREAADPEQVARFGMRAGHESLRAFAFAAADAHFTLTLESLPAGATSPRHEALTGRIRARDQLGDRAGQDADTALLLELAAALADPRAPAVAAYLRADLLWKVGNQAEALSFAKRALKLAEAAGAQEVAADCLTMLARISRNRGEFSRAQALLRQAQQRYRQAGNRFGEAGSLDKLANLLHEQGDYRQAAASHEQAAVLFRELGHARQEIRAISGLAKVMRAQGDYAAARRLHEQNVAAAQALGDLESAWVEQVILGNLAYELGDYETAIRWYEAGLALCRRLQDPFAEALVLYNLGEGHRELTAFSLARRHYSEALSICQARAFRRGEGNVLHSLGLLALAEGNLDESAAQLAAARDIWQALDQPLKLIETAAGQALIHLRRRELSAAAADMATALAGLDEQQRSTYRWRWIHYVAFRVEEARGDEPQAAAHLRLAALALADAATGVPDAERSRFLERVSIHRQIQQAVDARATVIVVSLPRREAPLGRALDHADYTTVSWTVWSPLDEAVAGSAARRRRQIRRLLDEAAEQGAAPTDSDLARVLGVSTRTIARDVAKMAAEGAAVPTRRRSARGK